MAFPRPSGPEDPARQARGGFEFVNFIRRGQTQQNPALREHSIPLSRTGCELPELKPKRIFATLEQVILHISATFKSPVHIPQPDSG
jgi:hypothetical protein